jgi:hypothetical protein
MHFFRTHVHASLFASTHTHTHDAFPTHPHHPPTHPLTHSYAHIRALGPGWWHVFLDGESQSERDSVAALPLALRAAIVDCIFIGDEVSEYSNTPFLLFLLFPAHFLHVQRGVDCAKRSNCAIHHPKLRRHMSLQSLSNVLQATPLLRFIQCNLYDLAAREHYLHCARLLYSPLIAD